MNKNILQVQVDLYSTVKDISPKQRSLYELLTTLDYLYEIDLVRTSKDQISRNYYKKELPAFTPSMGMGRPTGLIALDIDHKDNSWIDHYDKLKDIVAKLPFVAYCGKSVSGKGYFCLVRIPKDYTHFEGYFWSLEKLFREELGINLDKVCRDVRRKRFVSYDDRPYFNFDATVYDKVAEKYKKKEYRRADPYVSIEELITKDVKEVRRIVDIIVAREIDITYNYERWLKAAISLGDAFGELGRELFHSVSQFYPTYTYAESDKLYSDILKSSYKNCKIASFYYLVYTTPLLSAYVSFDEAISEHRASCHENDVNNERQ